MIKATYERDASTGTLKYYLDLKMDTAGTDITAIRYKVASDTRVYMSNTFINAGALEGDYIKIDIPEQIAFKIESCLKKQLGFGADKDHLELYTTVSVDYTVNKSANDKGTLEAKNISSDVLPGGLK